MYFALFYDTVPDYLERRQPLRQAHLDYAGRAYEEGKLILGGAFDRPPDGALIVFRAESRAEVEEFAEHDPYVVHGIVTSWRVRDWTVVIGGEK